MEISDSYIINSSSFELIKAKEKILDIEVELKDKDAQMAKVKDYLRALYSNLIELNPNIDSSDKVRKYELLLREASRKQILQNGPKIPNFCLKV